MEYIDLFLSFFQIGLFSFGGGMGAIPLIQEQVVYKHQWLSLAEFTDLITISQMTPGPIAVNASTFVGIRTHGILGAVVATTGCVLPACIIVSLLAWLYFRYKKLPYLQGVLSGIRPVIIALIATSGVSMFKLTVFEKGFNFIGMLLIILGVGLLKKYRVNPINIMLGSGIIGGVAYFLTSRG